MKAWLKGGLFFTAYNVFILFISLLINFPSYFYLPNILNSLLIFPINIISWIFGSILLILPSDILLTISQIDLLLNVMTLFIYIISNFIFGTILGILYTKSDSLKGGVIGYLVGITIIFLLSMSIFSTSEIAVLLIFAWIYYPIIIISPIIGFIVGKIKSKKQVQQKQVITK